jgi:hypothetical protein
MANEKNHTYDKIIMKMTFCFPVEISDYNQKLRIMSSVHNEKCFGEASCNEI